MLTAYGWMRILVTSVEAGPRVAQVVVLVRHGDLRPGGPVLSVGQPAGEQDPSGARRVLFASGSRSAP